MRSEVLLHIEEFASIICLLASKNGQNQENEANLGIELLPYLLEGYQSAGRYQHVVAAYLAGTAATFTALPKGENENGDEYGEGEDWEAERRAHLILSPSGRGTAESELRS